MRHDDIDLPALFTAVGRMPNHFRTWDVIDNPEMVVSHALFVEIPSYPMCVGKLLRKHEVESGIRWISSGSKRGAHWITV